jgi:N-acetylmuramoyl-L-alanine amidase
MPVRRVIVIHFTSGWSAESSISFWNTPKAKGANAHIIIDRDGTVYQCRSFNRTAGHAGTSQWKDPKTDIVHKGLNSCSIGIELANSGDMGAKTFPKYGMGSLAGKDVPTTTLRHKNGGSLTKWEIYPEAQLAACEALTKVIVKRYNLDAVLGHDDIAPARKDDPGPAFPMERMVKAAYF